MELASQVEDLTKAVQKLPSLIDAIWSLLTTTTGIFIFLLFLVFLLWLFGNKGFSPALEAFERKEKRRLEQLEAYVSFPESADPEAIKAIRDLRNAYYFKIATGIHAESKLRNVLIKMHETTSHHITWRQIRRALPYIEIDSTDTIKIRKPTRSEKITYRYNQCVAYTSLFVSAVLIMLITMQNLPGNRGNQH